MRVFEFLLISAVLAVAVGCSNDAPGGQEQPPTSCQDADGDGVDSCSDCDDADPNTAPGKAEVCDGKDNNCNGKVDDGCSGGADGGTPGACKVGESKKCGATGSSCIQPCLASGAYDVCQRPTGKVDTAVDPDNCGQCGTTCAAPANASRACRAGVCGRGPCSEGFFDLDGDPANGCEASCAGRTCTTSTGTVTFSAPPVPESGNVFASLSSGSAFGGAAQASTTQKNLGVLGGSTPPVKGAALQTSTSNKNLPGFPAALQK